MGNKLEILQNNRDKILLAEIGALIHDLGKLSEIFIRKQSLEESKKYGDYHHSKVLEYDSDKCHKYHHPNECEMEHLAKVLTDLLKRKIELDGEEITIYEIIEKHHDNVDKLLLKFITSADTFDADEDRAGAKDEQSICKTFKSSAFGYEKEINIEILLSERKKSYRHIIDYLDSLLVAISCNFDKISTSKLKYKRKICFEKIKKSFSKTLGMTARSANDVLLWEHSYMTATIMKCLLGQYLIVKKVLENDSKLDEETVQKYEEFLNDLKSGIKPKDIIKNNRPFSVFTIGWDFFGFIEQSHKIPDIVGRTKILDKIKREIKNIIEVDYVLGNEIYCDDFGIHFLIPSVLNEDDLEKIKEEIFKIFNEKTDGILLPIFVLTTSNDIEGDYKLGKLLSESLKQLKRKINNREYELLKTPIFIEKNLNSNSNDKLVCEVCGKGVYGKDDNDNEKLCETCKELRKIGREQKQPPQTVYIDEISWNPKNKEYEKVCLLIAKFDLDDWLNGKYIESLFIRKPNFNIITDCDSIFGYCNYYLKYEDLYNHFKKLKENEDINIDEKINMLLKICEKFGSDEVKKFLKNIGGISKTLINNLTKKPEDIIEKLHLPGKKKKAKNRRKFIEIHIGNNIYNTIFQILKDFEEETIINAYSFSKGNKSKFFSYLHQKPSSPSRIMRVWNTTKEFFNEIEKDICLRVPIIEEAIIKINNISEKDGNELSSGVAYIIEINELNLRGEAVYNKNSKELIVITPHLSEILRNKNPKGKKITIKDSNDKETIATATIKEIINNTRKVRAFRIISKSPTMFMAIIPASKSFEIVKMIKAKYEEEFGKAYGKLPLHIGLIYGKRKTPMYVLLDSARRMLKKFDEKLKSNEENDKNKIIFEVKKSEICITDNMVRIKAINEKTNFEYEFRIPFKLGDGSVDYYHPYLEVENSNNDKVICVYAGDKTITQKHVLKIKPEDKLKFNKYYFDFEYLDSNIRRFDLGVKRKHWLFTNPENNPKPYLLWDLDNFERLNRIIKEYNLTNTQIMNLYELLISKIEEWEIKNVDKLKNNKEFRKFVENSILDIPLRLKTKIKKREDEENKEFLINSILNGLFFDFVDLWHAILKKDFGGDENE